MCASGLLGVGRLVTQQLRSVGLFSIRCGYCWEMLLAGLLVQQGLSACSLGRADDPYHGRLYLGLWADPRAHLLLPSIQMMVNLEGTPSIQQLLCLGRWTRQRLQAATSSEVSRPAGIVLCPPAHC